MKKFTNVKKVHYEYAHISSTTFTYKIHLYSRLNIVIKCEYIELHILCIFYMCFCVFISLFPNENTVHVFNKLQEKFEASITLYKTLLILYERRHIYWSLLNLRRVSSLSSVEPESNTYKIDSSYYKIYLSIRSVYRFEELSSLYTGAQQLILHSS